MSGEVQRPQRSGEFPRGGADQVAELCALGTSVEFFWLSYGNICCYGNII